MSDDAYAKPDYKNLECKKCNNKTNFVEFALRETRQPFTVLDRGGPKDPLDQWGDYELSDGETCIAHEIQCGLCEEVVWSATITTEEIEKEVKT